MANELKDKYGIADSITQLIVEGIVRGNKEYAQMRVRENANLKISDGLAWARANYIDTGVANQIAIENQTPDKIKWQAAKSGYTWGYLRFLIDGESVLVVVKPTRAITQMKSNGKNVNRAFSQLSFGQLAKLNNHHFTGNKKILGNEQLELALSREDLNSSGQIEQILQESEEKIDRFLVVAYGLDERHNVKSAKLYMPNAIENSFVEIKDLTYLISTIDILNEQEQLAVKHDVEDDNYYEIQVEKLEESDDVQ